MKLADFDLSPDVLSVLAHEGDWYDKPLNTRAAYRGLYETAQSLLQVQNLSVCAVVRDKLEALLDEVHQDFDSFSAGAFNDISSRSWDSYVAQGLRLAKQD